MRMQTAGKVLIHPTPDVMNTTFHPRRLFLGLALASMLAACGGGGEDDLDFGTSGDSSTPAPSSFIGKKLVQTVENNDGLSTTAKVGKIITYRFVDENTVEGDGVGVRLTDDWSYSVSGSVAKVTLRYSNGTSVDELTFTSETGGTYMSNITFSSGQKNKHWGTFTISNL